MTNKYYFKKKTKDAHSEEKPHVNKRVYNVSCG